MWLPSGRGWELITQIMSSISLRDCCMRRVVWTYTLHLRYPLTKTTTTTTTTTPTTPTTQLTTTHNFGSRRFSQECPTFSCVAWLKRRQRHCRSKAARATAETVPSARTSERRHGPGRVQAPYLTRSEDGQGREGEGERGVLCTAKFRDNPLHSRSSSSCLRRSPAVPGHPVWESRGGHRRRSSCAPWSSLPTSCPWCRFWTFLGRREEDQVVEHLRKLDVPSVEQVIAVPMISLDGIPQLSAIRRPQKAEELVEVPTEPGYSLPCKPWGGGQQLHWRSRMWTIQFLRFGGREAEVFMVYEQDRVQQRRTWSRSLTFQSLWVGGRVAEVFKVLSQYRIQQLLRSRSLIFQLAVEAFKVFAQARVPQRPLPAVRFLTPIQGVSRTFPQSKKSAKVTRQSSPRVPASVSSSELSAHQVAPVGESDVLADERWREDG